jgi:hypothetical protein
VVKTGRQSVDDGTRYVGQPLSRPENRAIIVENAANTGLKVVVACRRAIAACH